MQEVPLQYWPTVVPKPTAQVQVVAHVLKTVALVDVVQVVGHAVQLTEPPVVVAATVKHPTVQAAQLATGGVATLKAQVEHPVGLQQKAAQ